MITHKSRDSGLSRGGCAAMIAEMLTCIALNVYYEARSEPLDSQVGVAHVVLNRVASDKFPDDACSDISRSGKR